MVSTSLIFNPSCITSFLCMYIVHHTTHFSYLHILLNKILEWRVFNLHGRRNLNRWQGGWSPPTGPRGPTYGPHPDFGRYVFNRVGGYYCTTTPLQIVEPSYSPGLSIVLEALFSFFCVSKCFTQQMEHQIPKMKKLRNLIIVLCILLQRGKRDSGNDLSVHTAWTWI